MNRRVFLAPIIILCGVIFILFLLTSLSEKPNSKKNGFNRTWLSPNITLISQARLNEPLTSICGATSENFFLAGNNAQWILMISRNLEKRDTFFVNITNNRYLVPPHNIVVDSPSVYLHINNMSIVLFANLINTKVDSIKLNTNLFTRSIQISDKRILIRAFDSSFKKQPFYLINTTTGNVEKSVDLVESEMNDAGFSSDGILRANNNKIIYAQYYRNKFFCMDTNLNLLYESTTIDTVKNNNLSFQDISYKKEHRKMYSKSRTVVNKDLFVDNNHIFIYSALKADNETEEVYNKNSIIDIYNLIDGQYIGSFKVPNIDGERLSKFVVKGKSLLALYKNHLAAYEFEL